MSTVIGIDLGTTNSLCAVFRGGAPELVPNACGELLTPSVVGALADGRVVVGSAAKELAIARPEACVAGFKRWMGTEREIELGGETLTPPGLASLVLASLKADAEAFLGEEVTEAVVTVPAYFNEHQREATKLAGELAGLRVRRILNEPTAAALTYGFHDREADKTLLVFDLGGGTLDVTLMEIFEGTLEILATAGESHLGGDDFTDKLVGWALEERGMCFETVEFREPRRLARLRQEAERAKRELGDADWATLRFPEADGSLSEGGEAIQVPASLFAEMVEGLVARLEPPIGKALRDGRHLAGQVDEVILVGGATRMPIVRQRVSDVFDAVPLSSRDPDHVVALGAAVQAALIADDRSVEDMVLTDVCPFTLGLEVTKEFGKQLVDGYYMPVIHRNTTIPVSKEEFVATLVADQPEIVLRIYQGDARRIKDNLYLGELAVKGLPKGPPGTPVAVRFTYDVSGLLEVEAYVPSTDEKFQTILTHHVKGLGEEEIARAARNLARLKFYPRDELANRRLVLYCERILGEIGPYEREGLDQMIDAFEDSMQSGDPRRFESTRRELLIRLSGLGFEFDESGDPGR